MPPRRRTPEPEPVDINTLDRETLEEIYERSRDARGRTSMERAGRSIGVTGKAFAYALKRARRTQADTTTASSVVTRRGPTIQEILHTERKRVGNWAALAESTAEEPGGPPRLGDKRLSDLASNGPGRVEFDTIRIMAESWPRYTELDLLLAYGRGAPKGGLDVDTGRATRLATYLTEAELADMTDADMRFIVQVARAHLQAQRGDRRAD